VDYPAALAYLDQHVNLEATAGKVHGLSLEKMRELVGVIGDPQTAYPAVHITGTNGKGSVARMVTALLREHGLSVGTYTSPDLERVNERLAWNLEPISDDTFARVVGELAAIEPLLETSPSRFELLTAAAFSWFAEIAVDVAVVEVGMLGRFDATNVVDGSVAVVTNIGADHTDRQGDWRAAIASEKAGIVKPDSTLVLGEMEPRLRPIFEAEGPAAIVERGVDFDIDRELNALGGRIFDVHTRHAEYAELVLPLYGAHQTDNAATAVVATEEFFGRALDVDTARSALAGVTIPGRFEVVHRNPLVIIDGAHNPDAARRVAVTLDDEFDLAGRRILVVGMLSPRDPVEMFRALRADEADLLIACAPDWPRAIPPDDIAAAARALRVLTEVVPDVGDAVRRALAVAAAEDAVVVTGSLYVAGAARTALAGGSTTEPTSAEDEW
jgi:dihydrofolate synthase/folylpolyglutamate synthase